jgi:hypothetical protein
MNAVLKSIDEPLFASAHGALLFAYHFLDAQYEPSAMLKLARKIGMTGKGLSGIDGAGQCGIIRSHVGKLPEPFGYVLVARIAPKSHPCDCRRPCCSGKRPNAEWSYAVDQLAIHAQGTLPGRTSYLLRRALVERYFGQKRRKLQEIAKACELNPNTVGKHNKAVTRWLDDYEGRALALIGDELMDAGIAGAV